VGKAIVVFSEVDYYEDLVVYKWKYGYLVVAGRKLEILSASVVHRAGAWFWILYATGNGLIVFIIR